MAADVPETPPVAPAAAPAATPSIADSFEAAANDAMKQVQTSIGEAILPSLEGGVADWVKTHDTDYKKLLSDYKHEYVAIDKAADLANLSIELRFSLLVKSWLGDLLGAFSTTKSKATEALQLGKDMLSKVKTLKFSDLKTYFEGKTTEGLKILPGSSHLIWRERQFFDSLSTLVAATDTSTKADKWQENFPYPVQSRIVMGEADTEAITKWAQPLFEKAGVKLKVVKVGEALVAPAADEIQILSVTEPKPMTWASVEQIKPYWEDSTSTQFSKCPQTLAALQMAKSREPGATVLTPQAACDAVGLTPDADFLKWLETTSDPAPATPPPSPTK